MSAAFKRIEKSLKEAIAFAEGKEVQARVTKVEVTGKGLYERSNRSNKISRRFRRLSNTPTT
jgi:hypothetical protein